MGMGLRGMVWGLWESQAEFNDFVLWWEVRGGQGLLGLGVRWEEPHFWVVTAVKDLPQLSPAAALAVTFLGYVRVGWEGMRPLPAQTILDFLCSQTQHSTWVCPLGWSCGRWCRTGVPGFPSASPARCNTTAHPFALSGSQCPIPVPEPSFKPQNHDPSASPHLSRYLSLKQTSSWMDGHTQPIHLTAGPSWRSPWKHS